MEKKSAAKLAQARETLRLTEALQQSLASAVVAADSHRRIITFNHAAEILAGSPAHTMLGQSVDVLPPPLRDAMAETFAHGRAVTDRELSLDRDGAPALLVLANTFADCDAQGGVRS